MKGLKTAREVAVEVLTKVEKEKSYSNLQLNETVQKTELSRADINFATEIVYGTIQHLNTIDWLLQSFLKTKINKLEIWVKNLLRLSIYQIRYLDRVPDHAVVNEAVNIAKQRGHKGIAGMVNGVLRNIIRQKDNIYIPKDLPDYERISLEYSHPEWMVKDFISSYGVNESELICQANNLAPFHSVRINPLKTTRDEVIEYLRKELAQDAEIAPSMLSKQGIRIRGGGNLALTEWYKNGYITIQDESSMLVADVLDPQANMAVLDVAAAPGGKTTHIAEKMMNKGKIIAVDVHEHKIRLIEEQQRRLGLNIIDTLLADARDLDKRIKQTFDRILLDVPCSGFGVIRRKPDLKWRKTSEDVKELVKIQNEILNVAASLLKPGGVMVYSTCTITGEENEQQVLNFLTNHAEFQLDTSLPKFLPNIVNDKLSTEKGMFQILPHHFHTDGFFISRLLKTK